MQHSKIKKDIYIKVISPLFNKINSDLRIQSEAL